MGVIGLQAFDLTNALRVAFENCCKAWGSDPAYREAKYQIEKGLREIELIEASPGQRAARSRPAPAPTGQDRSGY
jgi:hypothetical protein